MRTPGQTSDNPGPPISLAAHDPFCWCHGLDAVQRGDRTVVPTHVLDRACNLAILDQEQSVAGGRLGWQDSLWIEHTDVPKTCHQQAPLDAFQQLLGRAPAPVHNGIQRCRHGGLVLSLGPKARVIQVREYTSLDPLRTFDRQSLLIERTRSAQADVSDRNRCERCLRQLVADQIAATLSGKVATPFVSRPRVSRKQEVPRADLAIADGSSTAGISPVQGPQGCVTVPLRRQTPLAWRAAGLAAH